MDKKFEGFLPETIKFLNDLRDNNSKSWFEAHRYLYEDYLLNPFRALVSDIGYYMLSIDPYFEITPAVGKTISRIYRDIRFSKDKSPYRANMWITFRRMSQNWKEDPAFFFEIMPDFYRYGMGFYSTTRSTMDVLRQHIHEGDREFKEIFSLLNKTDNFILEGEEYKRPFRKDLPQEYKPWYQKKDIYITHNSRDFDNLFSDKLVNEIIDGFEFLKPFYSYFWRIKR